MKQNGILVFAYGSNLDEAQMLQRCPSAEVRASAMLPHHRLAFAGYSIRWDGAVATLEPAHGSQVHGLVYRISEEDLLRLDTFEGCPWSYFRKRTVVTSARGTKLAAATYVQPPYLEQELPSNQYFNKIWRAYERLGFDVRPLFAAVRNAA
jgi:gamma-glutamylcyclotransferase (GGCT)/AIG2-like uncharacterized protein YtfP